jgi:hypothetical protein
MPELPSSFMKQKGILLDDLIFPMQYQQLNTSTTSTNTISTTTAAATATATASPASTMANGMPSATAREVEVIVNPRIESAHAHINTLGIQTGPVALVRRIFFLYLNIHTIILIHIIDRYALR